MKKNKIVCFLAIVLAALVRFQMKFVSASGEIKITRLLIFTLIFFGSSILPLKAFGQSVNQKSFINPKMSLTVTLDKSNYFPWEPITLHARFENKTDAPLATLRPYMLMDSIILVGSASEKREFAHLTIYASQLARQAVTFSPGEGFEQSFTLESSLDELFPKSGSYVIRFMLNSYNEKRLVSNPVEITIDDVTGIDKEALDFIDQNKVHRYYPMLFSWDLTAKTKDGRTILEDFVQKYSQSIYGDRAILELGKYYMVRGDSTKARSEFDKIRFSSNPKIANKAKQFISELHSF